MACLSAVGAESAAAADLKCGATVTSSVVLSADLTRCPDFGLRIAADDVTVDLNGHTIAGVGIGHGVLIDSRRRVTVKHGTVRAFRIGVFVTGGDHNHL